MILPVDHTPAQGARRLVLVPVLIQGPSMAPALRHGDAVLARRGGRDIRPGDIVLARFRSRPQLLVVKRVARWAGDGWWLLGDNQLVTDDSRAYGVADVEARVILRYWPPYPRLHPRRVSSWRRDRGTHGHD